MGIENKILEELKRFNQITKYVLNEQEPPAPPVPGEELPPAPAGDVPPVAGDVPPAPEGGAMAPPVGETPPAGETTPTEVPEPIDVETDPDVEEIGDEDTDKGGDEDTEEIDITDLVTAQKEIGDKQNEIMDTLFSRLDDLQAKLENMDQIMNKINSLEVKFDKYRDKTPEEKLELRSLDSYPYNQKLTDFFDDKKIEMEKAGKNEYVLTSDEVENFSPNEIKKTFNKYDEEEEM